MGGVIIHIPPVIVLFCYLFLGRGSNSSWILTDAHVVQLSRELTNLGDLRKLAYRGLKLESSDVESAITNAPNDIQTAAYRILQEWMKQQEHEEEIYTDLKEALNECNMKMLVSKLTGWVEEPSFSLELSPERMYPGKFSTQTKLKKIRHAF